MEKKIQLTVVLAFMAFTGVFLASCYPTDDVSYSDLDLVGTIHDESIDFKNFKTYVVPDTIVHMIDTVDESNNVDISRQYDQQILNLVNQNMVDYGYVKEVNPTENPPDVVLTVSAMATENYQVWSWYPSYWGWYWPYYKGTNYWWGYYPPYWGGGTYVTSYTTGTIIVNMLDLKEHGNIIPENDTVNTVWIGTVNGLLGSSISITTSRLNTTINQAFEQSQYLDIK